MNSAPNVRQAFDGKTHVIPPSFRCFPARFTGLRIPRIAQLALMADARSPSRMTIALFAGNSVVITAKGNFKPANVGGRCSAQKRSSASPTSNFGQKIWRARATISCHSIPAASTAPIKLPALVPVTTAGSIPASDKALRTPMCASPRTEPPLRANPIR